MQELVGVKADTYIRNDARNNQHTRRRRKRTRQRKKRSCRLKQIRGYYTRKEQEKERKKDATLKKNTEEEGKKRENMGEMLIDMKKNYDKITEEEKKTGCC